MFGITMDEIEQIILQKIKFHEEQLAKLKETLAFYQNRKTFEENPSVMTVLESLFTQKLPLKEKVLIVIQANNRFTKTVWITEYLKSSYPQKDPTKFRMQISALLSEYGRTGILVSFRLGSGKKDTVWGFPNWVDDNGFPKPEYRYVKPSN